jgi:class 3 adenylate cyclase
VIGATTVETADLRQGCPVASGPVGKEGRSTVANDEPFGYVVLDPGSAGESTLLLWDRLFVGRECAGVEESRRIVLPDDLAVSRNHLEIRVDVDSAQATVVDTSSNGSRINGVRIERSVPIPLSDGDQIQVGSHVLGFHSATVVARGSDHASAGATVSIGAPSMMAMVVGDLINFSTVSEAADHEVLARDVDSLYRELRALLTQHRGTLVDYVGDAFFASWEFEVDPAAPDNALNFVLAAAQRVAECTAGFELRYADGTPLRMGWAITMGSVVMRLMPGAVVMALGDMVNVSFRIASIAGREGRPDILATHSIKLASRGPFRFGEPETVPVKGRIGTETIYGVFAP